jgi:DNA ligase-1
MRAFAHLLDRLSLTASRSAKLTLTRDFLRESPDPDRGWALAALTGNLVFKAAKPAAIRAAVEGRMDPTLFAWSYDYVGDLAETVALVWPARPGANREPELSEVVDALSGATRPQAQALIEGWLDALGPDSRWALLKLVTGGLRVGLSARLAKQATADLGGVPVAEIEEIWHALTPPYEDLFAWLEGKAPRPDTDAPGRFRPVMLAHAIDEAVDFARLDPADYAAEWKWDGIRVQAVNERGERRLYSRTGDVISDAFPDVLAALDFEGVIDGELVVMRDGAIASFGELQQRLNRKTADAKLMAAYPAGIRAYDLLLDGEDDLRARPFADRRGRLEQVIARAQAGCADAPRLDLSPLQPFDDWAQLAALRADPPPGDARNAEGVMLKRWDSPYLAGRPKGPWFKWKRDARLVDAVLLYAQRGHGKRSSFYSDYTFGVWREDAQGARALTPVGKAYFGFTDEELKQLDAFVRENTTERFGPVRAVRADHDFGLVLEVAFEGLQRSTRHKSGLAMRFPRIHRIRWDKPARDADDLATLERLLEVMEGKTLPPTSQPL